MNSSTYPPIERLRYWEGQMLRSGDFNDQAALDAQMRWWHNRALHRAFGVSMGLEVSPITKAAKQLAGVRVSEGVAYDCFGREFVLCPSRDVALPEMPGLENVLLLLRRKQQRAPGPRKRFECVPPSCATKQNETELVWKSPGECEAGDGVPLARISVLEKKPQLDPLFQRPVVHALARPCVVNGTTLPGKTAWEEFSLYQQIGWGVQTHIDTTAAGFIQKPAYFAWLAITAAENHDERSTVKLLSLPTDIVDATSVGFTFRILMSRSVSVGNEAEVAERPTRSFTLRARKLGLRLCWLGCEHMPEPSVCQDDCDCQCAGEHASATASAGKENRHAH